MAYKIYIYYCVTYIALIIKNKGISVFYIYDSLSNKL